MCLILFFCTEEERAEPSEAVPCPSVVFKQRQTAIISSYSWLLTVKIPLEHHQRYLQQLLNATVTIESQAERYFQAMRQLQNASDTFWSTPEWYDRGMGGSSRAFHRSQATLLRRELELIGLRVRELVQIYNELTAIYLNLQDDSRFHVPKSLTIVTPETRQKRWVSALLGVFSSGLGIASLIEVAGLKNHVRQLADRQQTLLQSNQQMWMILNQTLSSVNENTNRIDALSEHVEHVVSTLEELLTRFANQVKGELVFNMLSQTLQSCIS